MKNEYVYVKGNVMGFGATEEERLHDWELNKMSVSGELIGDYRWMPVRYNPWFPTSKMLHISEVGCLYYEQSTLVNTRNQQRVNVNKFGRCIYYYLMKLFGDTVTYELIKVVLRESLDSFFQNISTSFAPLNDYNQIFIADEGDFEDYALYRYDGYDVIYNSATVGIRVQGCETFYTVFHQDDLQADLCYLAYRAGIYL